MELITTPLLQFRQELAKLRRLVQLHNKAVAVTYYGGTIGFLVPLALVAQLEANGKTIKSQDKSLKDFRSELLESWELVQLELDCIYLSSHRRRVVAFISPRFWEMMDYGAIALDAPDYDHVAPFKDGHVSWVESYEYLGRIGNGYHYKIKAENSGFMDAVFCQAVDFWDVVDKTPITPKSFREGSFWIIVEDYLPEIEIDRFIYTRKKPLVPYFMDAHSSIHHNMLTWNLLDGVIQEKLQEMCNGTRDQVLY